MGYRELARFRLLSKRFNVITCQHILKELETGHVPPAIDLSFLDNRAIDIEALKDYEPDRYLCGQVYRAPRDEDEDQQ